ncbi:MAG: NADH-quinone oxidoreductase subunit M [Azospirillum sp.]|nr:NADH-quinone oxidoreductase subunit M [Azospirillum sp.]
MFGLPILTTLLLVPLAGIAAILLATKEGKQGDDEARWLALLFSLATLALALGVLTQFDPSRSSFQFEEQHDWIPALGLHYHLGVDGISVWLVALSALLVPFAVVASWSEIKIRVREFMSALLLLQALLIGTFSALDLVVFYLFYEGNLLPMFVIIGTWGGEQRGRAAFKFILFNMTGSVFLLLALITIGTTAGSFEIPVLIESHIPASLQTWLWLAMFVSFAVKMPLWPVHTWLPEVHVQAPTAASMLIAGVHMKLGTYGFLRLLLPLLPDACDTLAPLVLTLGAITVVQNSLVAFTQVHLKKVLAYATVAHMGMTAIGVFSRTIQSIEGTIIMVFAQGLVSACLFMCVGLLHQRVRTYDAGKIAGVIQAMPRFAFVMLMLILGAVALPGTGNFVGELLILIGAFQTTTGIAILAATAIILGPVYFLGIYHKIIFAPSRTLAPGGSPGGVAGELKDLGRGEMVALGSALVVMVWLGIHPPPFLTNTSRSVVALVSTQHFQVRQPQTGAAQLALAALTPGH